MHINIDALKAMDRRYRATFINSLAGYRQAVLVGTRSKAGISNLAVFNSLMHIGADPAMYGLLFRPDTVRRDTLENITETGCFTLNYMRSSDYIKVHWCSAKFEQGVSEFDAVGFKEVQSQYVSAPYVAEAVVNIALEFTERLDIRSNGTILMIGCIKEIVLNDRIIRADGFADLESADVLACAGLDSYFSPRLLGRLTYARPDTAPEPLESERMPDFKK